MHQADLATSSQRLMLSLSQFQAEVERLSSDCSFLFDDSYSEQICWTHCSSCPATSTQRFERCTCTAGIMTRKQMETFEHNLREHTESGKEGNGTSLKVSNVPALSFIASFLGTQCGTRYVSKIRSAEKHEIAPGSDHAKPQSYMT